MKYYTKTGYLLERVKNLEKQLEEKDSMIDWLANKLIDIEEHYRKTEYNRIACKELWKKVAQDAVKKND